MLLTYQHWVKFFRCIILFLTHNTLYGNRMLSCVLQKETEVQKWCRLSTTFVASRLQIRIKTGNSSYLIKAKPLLLGIRFMVSLISYTIDRLLMWEPISLSFIYFSSLRWNHCFCITERFCITLEGFLPTLSPIAILIHCSPTFCSHNRACVDSLSGRCMK